MTQIIFSATPGRLWDSSEEAAHAIEVDPCRFPAGYFYTIERRRISSDRGRTIVERAVVCAYDEEMRFAGFVPFGESEMDRFVFERLKGSKKIRVVAACVGRGGPEDTSRCGREEAGAAPAGHPKEKKPIMKKRCEICGIRPAAIPDRNRQGRPIKGICRECHADRLVGDMIEIMRDWNKRHPIPRPDTEGDGPKF